MRAAQSLPLGGPPTRARGPVAGDLGKIHYWEDEGQQEAQPCQLTHAREQPRKMPSPGGAPEQATGEMPSAIQTEVALVTNSQLRIDIKAVKKLINRNLNEIEFGDQKGEILCLQY